MKFSLKNIFGNRYVDVDKFSVTRETSYFPTCNANEYTPSYNNTKYDDEVFPTPKSVNFKNLQKEVQKATPKGLNLGTPTLTTIINEELVLPFIELDKNLENTSTNSVDILSSFSSSFSSIPSYGVVSQTNSSSSCYETNKSWQLVKENSTKNKPRKKFNLFEKIDEAAQRLRLTYKSFEVLYHEYLSNDSSQEVDHETDHNNNDEFDSDNDSDDFDDYYYNDDDDDDDDNCSERCLRLKKHYFEKYELTEKWVKIIKYPGFEKKKVYKTISWNDLYQRKLHYSYFSRTANSENDEEIEVLRILEDDLNPLKWFANLFDLDKVRKDIHTKFH